MKKPRHTLIPNDWPFLERIINEIDITISEAKSEVVSTVLILESEMSAAQAAISNIQLSTTDLESRVSALEFHEPVYVAAYGALVHTLA